MSYVYKWYWERMGGHVHVDLFVAKGKNFTYARAGSLVFRPEEWDDLSSQLSPFSSHDLVELNRKEA